MIHALQPFCAEKLMLRAADLMHAVMQAHSDDAGKMPQSTMAAAVQGSLGCNFESAVMAAMIAHQPVSKARVFWFCELEALNHGTWKDALRARLVEGALVPGFNTSNAAGEFAAISKVLSLFPAAESLVVDAAVIVREFLPEAKPTLDFYTALACELVKMNYGVEGLIFILSRLPIWGMAWGNALAQSQPK